MNTPGTGPDLNRLATPARMLLTSCLGAWLAGGCVKIQTEGSAMASEGASFPMYGSFPRPTVPVQIEQSGPHVFILDTGASVTLIDEALAGDLGLTPTGTGEVKSPLRDEPMLRPTVALTGLSIGSLSLPNLTATSFDLRSLLGGDGPVGVLGVMDLSGYLVTFDYASERVKIVQGSLPEPDGSEVFEFSADEEIPALPLQVAGRAVTVHVDTGSPGGITLPFELASELPLVSEPLVMGQMSTVDNTVAIWGATLDGDVSVGDLVLERPEVQFLKGVPVGTVGNRFLVGRVLTVDPKNRRLRLEESAAPKVVRARGPKRYGIRFRDLDASPIAVVGVDEDSPAHAGGLRAGDLIETINGVAVSELPRGDLISALRASPLEVVVVRDGSRRELSMSLE